MFNNQKNNAREGVNVNTRGIQLMNNDGITPSTMLLAFWNQMISIKIHPALEKSQQTDSKKYNYDEVIATTLTLEKATIIADAIDSKILPAFTNTESTFIGVTVSGDSLFGVGVRVVDTTPTAYAAIFKGIDESTRKPETGIFYDFKTTSVIKDYDPTTGEYAKGDDVPGELLLFGSALKESVQALTHAQAHSTKVTDKFFRDRMMNVLDEIGAKVGVEPRAKSNWSGGGNNYNKSKDIFSGGNSSVPADGGLDLDGGSAAINKLSNINDIRDFM